jgi:hypothetical protein
MPNANIKVDTHFFFHLTKPSILQLEWTGWLVSEEAGVDFSLACLGLTGQPPVRETPAGTSLVSL